MSKLFKDVFIHESSYIDDNVAIGSGSKVWHFSHILSNTQIGEGCSIGQNVVIGPSVSVGNRVKIQNNVSVYEGVTLEDGVFCGPSCVFTNVNNPRSEIVRKDEYRKTMLELNDWTSIYGRENQRKRQIKSIATLFICKMITGLEIQNDLVLHFKKWKKQDRRKTLCSFTSER